MLLGVELRRPLVVSAAVIENANELSAIRVFETAEGGRGRLARMAADELSEGAVELRVEWSGINYKDALAVSGRGKIVRRFPLNAGIDLAGTVLSSQDPEFRPGDAVLANGMGLGETHDGGFAERARLPAEWLVRLPEGLDARAAMALGTAGFTAAQALARMEDNGQSPELGPIVVSGASGGVGAIAISLLSGLGYEVIAVSGRREHHEWLRALGAGEARTPEELELGSRPLESARWAGVIDNVGGELLAGLVRHVGTWGNVALVGNAGGAELTGTVFPHILRGVSLLGVSSTNCPMPLRRELWQRLGGSWLPGSLERIVDGTVELEGVPAACERLLGRQLHGRTLVRCAR
jgi:NADPH2:quinone reductase